jgi:hypothetical protein
MRKITITILALMLCNTIISQTEAGTIMLNGSLGYSSFGREVKDENSNGTINQYDNSYMNIALRGGYFVVDNLAVGLVVQDDYSTGSESTTYTNTINKYNATNSSNLFSVGLFGRYYQKLGESKFSMFYQLSALYGMGGKKGEQRSTNGSVTTVTADHTDRTQVSVNLTPGIAFFASDRVAFEASVGNLGFSSSTETFFEESKKDKTETNTNFGLNLSLASLNFGVTFFFGGGGGGK